MVGSKELHRVDVGEVLKQLEMDYACHYIELREGVVHIFWRLHQEYPYACKIDCNKPVTWSLLSVYPYTFSWFFISIEWFKYLKNYGYFWKRILKKNPNNKEKLEKKNDEMYL